MISKLSSQQDNQDKNDTETTSKETSILDNASDTIINRTTTDTNSKDK